MLAHFVLQNPCFPTVPMPQYIMLFSPQIQSLKQMMVEKETALVAHKEQLTKDLEVSRASEQHVKDSMQMLETEVSKLRLSLQSTESRAEALASECQHACSARWEAQSQLTKLSSVLQYMLCNSPDEKLERRGQGDNNISNSLSISGGELKQVDYLLFVGMH